MISSISMSEFLKLNIRERIIDIRNPQQFNNNHIPGAKNISFEKLLIEPEKYIEKYKTYYIYCQKGIKSMTIVRRLNKLGFKTVNIEGGYESWILES